VKAGKLYSKHWSLREDALKTISKTLTETEESTGHDDALLLLKGALVAFSRAVRDNVFAVRDHLNILYYCCSNYTDSAGLLVIIMITITIIIIITTTTTLWLTVDREVLPSPVQCCGTRCLLQCCCSQPSTNCFSVPQTPEN